MEQIQYKMTSKIGPLYMVASKQGLQSVSLDRQPVTLVKKLGSRPEEKVLSEASRQLREYFALQRKTFDVPFDLSGTAFQKRVWRQLIRIPFGKTASYKDVARNIGNPGASRAVGSANGKNPVCIMIPCHRVIASDGAIGGYSGGIGIKRQLLKLEGIDRDGIMRP